VPKSLDDRAEAIAREVMRRSAVRSACSFDHKPSKEHALLTAERRITSLAIASALSSNDFGTAFDAACVGTSAATRFRPIERRSSSLV
jgi:hypothetical protein